jgi:hypothetical protein
VVAESSKAKKTVLEPAKETQLWEILEEVQDQLEQTNKMGEEWLHIFWVDIFQSQKVFCKKMDKMRGHWDLSVSLLTYITLSSVCSC